jgi:hypothetical protein
MSPCQEKVDGRPRKGGAGAKERSVEGRMGRSSRIKRWQDTHFPFQMEFCLI